MIGKRVQHKIAIITDNHTEMFVDVQSGMNFLTDEVRLIGNIYDVQDGRISGLSLSTIAFLTNRPNREWC